MLLANFLELTLRAFYFVYPKCQHPCSTGIGCLRHFLTATESPEENYLEKRDGGATTLWTPKKAKPVCVSETTSED